MSDTIGMNFTAKQMQDFINDALVKKTKEIEDYADRESRSVLWIVLRNLQPLAENKLREIVQEEIYDSPETNYYHRTGAFLESATVRMTQGGGHYAMQVFFDPNVLAGYEGKSTDREGDFWSYSYTFGKEANRGLNNGEFQWLITTMVEEGVPCPNNEMYTHNNIKDKFETWIQTNFSDLLNYKFKFAFKRFHVRFKKRMLGTGKIYTWDKKF